MSERSSRILKAIEKSSLSYGELSKLTGIPKSALQRYATGETEKIPIDRVELIAAATRVDTKYLMGWSENKDVQIIEAPSLSNMEERMLAYFRLLNKRGRERALEAIEEFTMIDPYTEEDKEG